MRVLACAALAALPLGAATCEGLATAKLANTRINAAQTVAAGAFPAPPGGQAGQAPIDFKSLPAFCRVQGVIEPTADSHIEFEVWLPVEGWNGKYRGVGNGGFAGAIDYGGLANSLAYGYAASATDTGHKGGVTDAGWALGHPEKVADFGYRAIHETAEKAKELVKAYYTNAPRRSYFSSCSNGGREALMEAQRYPADYDGILAGAPANYWTHLLTQAVADLQALNEPGAYIPAAKIPAIQAATLAACDARDGVKDGVIDDPSRCRFDPGVLLCKDADSDACLTAPQVTALKKLYAGARDAAGKQIFPGRVVGGEAGPNAWTDWITGREPNRSLMFAFGTQFFGNMVYENASWDFHTFQADRAAKVADDKLASTLNATDADLKRFRDHGGRLIIYHGWSDAAISPLNSIDYFEAVEKKMSAKTADGFVRLYMAPGMTHCGGGPGPDNFGQFGLDASDAQHNISKALERWVEDGAAPEAIVATKYKAAPGSEVVRTRPLCPYPQVAQYKGSGSTDDAANFACVKGN